MAKCDAVVTIKVTISLWSAIKLRIAGIKKKKDKMITAPLPTEPRPRSKDPPRSFLVNQDSTGARKHKPKGSESDMDEFERYPYGPNGPRKHDPTKGSDDDVQ